MMPKTNPSHLTAFFSLFPLSNLCGLYTPTMLTSRRFFMQHRKGNTKYPFLEIRLKSSPGKCLSLTARFLCLGLLLTLLSTISLACDERPFVPNRPPEMCVRMIVPCPRDCRNSCIYPDVPCPMAHEPRCPQPGENKC
ncbi:hypothetical protein CLU79DRAFT_244794 [Phycomyces nitens]|nr:hypothetical protein CLU79DRAFT_244794 [Phycomyces nitens]